LAAGANTLFQDHQGYLWLGTGAGLYRFDGESFLTFTMEQGLPGDTVQALWEDQEHRLWVGTHDNGVGYLQQGQFIRFTTEDGLGHNNVWSIREDLEGRLWFATLGGGVSCFDGVGFKTYTTEDGLADNVTRALCASRTGDIWIGTFGQGISRFDGEHFTNYSTEEGLPSPFVFSLFEDSRGRLWIGLRDGGVSCFDGETFTNYSSRDGLGQNSVRAICEDRNGNMWFGTVGGGISSFDGERFATYTAQDGLLANHVSDLWQDREGYLWISHSLAGLTCFDPLTWTMLTNEPVSETIVQDSRGRLWFGNENLLCCLDGRKLRSKVMRHSVFALLIDDQERLWVAVYGEGIYRFDTDEDVWADRHTHYGRNAGLPSLRILKLLQARDGSIWAGTAAAGASATTAGFLCKKANGERFQAVETPHPVVFRLLEDSKGRIWMGGFEGGGLSYYADGKITNFTIKDGLPNDKVQSLVEDDAGRIWIGTQHGLACFDGTSFTTYGPESGMASLHHQVSARDVSNKLWFGTITGGIYRTDGQHFQWLTAKDGLPSNSTTGILPQPDGSVIIGTYRGIVRYRPTAILPPKIKIEEAVADGVYAYPDALELTTLQAQLVSVSFRGLSMGTQRMRYCYRLEGLEKDWHDSWEDSVRYEDLAPGEYTFNVYAINRDLVCSDVPASLPISIQRDSWEELQAEYEARIGRMERQIELQERVNRQNATLMTLARSKTAERGDVDAALNEIVEAAAIALRVSRCGIWLFNKDHSRLQCVAMYDRESSEFTRDQALVVADYSTFLRALDADRTIAVEDTRTDPRTLELVTPYLEPVGIQALLDAPIRIGGETVGAVSHEHKSSPRQWTLDEQHFVNGIVAIVSLALEANERRRAEEETRRIRRYLQNVIDSMPSILVAVDPDGHIIQWNKEAARVTGLAAEEVEGRSFKSVFPHLEQQMEQVKQAVTRREPIKTERLTTERGGETRFSDVVVYPLTANGVEGAVIRVDDVTARVRIEEMMVQTEKMMSVGGLAAGMAHEINNPLGAILQGCQNIVRRVSPDLPKNQEVAEQLGIDLDLMHKYLDNRGILRFIDGIREAGSRAAKIVADMLHFSRRSDSRFLPVDLTDLADAAIRLATSDYDLKKKYDFKQVEIERDYDPDLDKVLCDRTQIEQVLLNLVKNAAQAMASVEDLAKPKLTLRTRREGDFARIEVIDNGPGMDEATRKRVFEPFFTTKEVGVGTGLGLSVSYFIITEQHKGHISVESQPGQGARFVVLLPFTQEDKDGSARTDS
jgi:PAS domain S-box-containing protein